MMIWCWRSENCHHGQGVVGSKIASAPSSSSWEVYNEPDSSKLEAAYNAFHDQIQTSSTNHVSTSDENGRTVILQRGSNVYICDIVKMEQRNLDTGFIRSIHRGWPTTKESISNDSIKMKSKKSSSITNTMNSVTTNAAPSSAVGRVPCPSVASTTLPVPNNHHHNNNQNYINYHHRVTGLVKKLNRDEIFVFGSNEAGRHGLGAAKIAKQKWGAFYGQAEGLQGRTYGIPTKDKYVRNPLPLRRIDYYVQRFVKFATDHRHFKFWVTEIGCGLSGYTPNDIAPLFQSAIPIENICLPESFWKHLLSEVDSSIASQVATATATTTTKTGAGASNNKRRKNKFTWNNH